MDHAQEEPSDLGNRLAAKQRSFFGCVEDGEVFDAADSVSIFSGEKGDPTTVEHEKDRLIGTELDSFGLGSEDVSAVDADGTLNPRWGLRATLQGAAQMVEAEEKKSSAAHATSKEKYMRSVQECMRKMPDYTWKGTRTALASHVGGTHNRVMAAIGDLVTRGLIDERMKGRKTEALVYVMPGT